MNGISDQELEELLKSWNKDMNRGLLQLLVLAIIVVNDHNNKPPCHGYSITKTLKEISKDTIRVAAGTIYPLLHRLRDKGFIQDIDASDYNKNVRNPTMYLSTNVGREFLSVMMNRWEEVNKIVKLLKKDGMLLIKSKSREK